MTTLSHSIKMLLGAALAVTLLGACNKRPADQPQSPTTATPDTSGSPAGGGSATGGTGTGSTTPPPQQQTPPSGGANQR
ncbi:hypothetical protein FHW58_002327 [Duganella sp. 1224]|uniref:hypothetical protein n=1 Tax=Duganella sp. 1224 TaxID=2587052 RepID=UPI0015CBBD69|nr:hypothetical protein [Duganella sp. 1224]NYE61175.1 hypothetical protein [Duganella sp. 1224]